MSSAPTLPEGSGRPSFAVYAEEAAKTLASVTGPGLVAGLIAGGLGSRLAMRIMALTSPEAVQGVRTDADAIVGEITLGGTIFLMLFGAVIGAAGGLVYLVIRRWLPGGGWKQGLVLGVVLLAASGRLLVEPDNIDFLILDPAALAVAMFLSLPLIFGMIFVPLHERTRRFLRGERSKRTTAATFVSLVPVLALGPMAVVVVLAGLIVFGLRKSPPFWRSKSFVRIGYAALTTATVSGLTFTAEGVLTIL